MSCRCVRTGGRQGNVPSVPSNHVFRGRAGMSPLIRTIGAIAKTERASGRDSRSSLIDGVLRAHQATKRVSKVTGVGRTITSELFCHPLSKGIVNLHPAIVYGSVLYLILSPFHPPLELSYPAFATVIVRKSSRYDGLRFAPTSRPLRSAHRQGRAVGRRNGHRRDRSRRCGGGGGRRPSSCRRPWGPCPCRPCLESALNFVAVEYDFVVLVLGPSSVSCSSAQIPGSPDRPLRISGAERSPPSTASPTQQPQRRARRPLPPSHSLSALEAQ